MKEEWIDMDKMLLGALKACETREQVEDIFKKFNTDDLRIKIDYLNECMGNPETFFSGDTPDLQSEYITTRAMFLTGEWKLNELYERAGSFDYK